MRFRLANAQPTQSRGATLGDGIANAAQMYFMAPFQAAQAAEQAQQDAAKTALLGSQQTHLAAETDQAKANTALLTGKTAALADQQQRGTLGNLLATAALTHGLAPSETADFSRFAQTGQTPERFDAPVDGVGPTMQQAPLPAYQVDGTAQKIYKTLGLTQQALAIGDKNVDNIAKAQGVYRSQDLGDDVLAGRRTAGAVGESQAAADGKKIFDNIGNTGSGFNQFTGAKQILDPGLVSIFGEQAAAQVAKEKAQAGASNASAAHSYAGAAKTRLETDQIRNAPKGRYDPTTGMLIDERAGTARPVLDQNGQPLPAKVGSLNGEQANALTFANRMQASQDILDQMAAKGVTRGSLIKQGAEAVPLVGGALGMVANAAASPEQQQVEQAQRDFINAVLRRESGAAISTGEFANARQQYFDQPNDSPQVKAQKREARQRVINGMLAAVPANMRTLPAAPVSAGATGATGGWAPSSAAPAASQQRNVTVSY